MQTILSRRIVINRDLSNRTMAFIASESKKIRKPFLAAYV